MTRKVLLVGDGAVGSNFANDLLQATHVDELVICDLSKDRAAGDSLANTATLVMRTSWRSRPAAPASRAKAAWIW